MTTEVAVVGAGTQGVCTALELSQRGARVHLFERESAPLTAASRAGEGKIHCGFTYAHDPSRRTATMMRDGALAFAPLLARWIGEPLPEAAFSSPFLYGVHRDSLLTVAQVETHFSRLERDFWSAQATGNGAYPGWDGGPPFERASSDETQEAFGPDIVAAFRTIERAVDPETLCARLKAAMEADERIRFYPNTLVSAVEGEHPAFTVVTEDEIHGPFHHVVNTAWAGRLVLDATRGLVPGRRWLFRYKVGIEFTESNPGTVVAPSTTIVLGPFGDVVDRGGGRWYLSWYPENRIGVSDSIEPGFDFTQADLAPLASKTLDALEQLIPGLAPLRVDVDSAVPMGGVIFSWGDRDIDTPRTELHERHDIGVSSHDGYHTVDTGKLTTAPLFAVAVAERILPRA